MASTNTLKPFSRYILQYGIALALLIFLLQWMQWKYLILDHSVEIYMCLVAVFFTSLGIWIASHLTQIKTEKVIVEKIVYTSHTAKKEVDQQALKALKLSKREYEILLLIIQGYSNADIASNLFLTISTVKTHVSNLYSKLDVKRRTQAIEKARRLNIVK